MELLKYDTDFDNVMDEIAEIVPPVEMMTVIAEEAAELSHAALKLKRVISPRFNPPADNITYEHAVHNLLVEIADVYVALLATGYIEDDRKEFVLSMAKHKAYRWFDRLKEQQQKEDGAV